jgi:hypothetical protein
MKQQPYPLAPPVTIGNVRQQGAQNLDHMTET